MFDPLQDMQTPLNITHKPKKTKLKKAWEWVRAGLIVLGAFTIVKGCHSFLYGYNYDKNKNYKVYDETKQINEHKQRDLHKGIENIIQDRNYEGIYKNMYGMFKGEHNVRE